MPHIFHGLPKKTFLSIRNIHVEWARTTARKWHLIWWCLVFDKRSYNVMITCFAMNPSCVLQICYPSQSWSSTQRETPKKIKCLSTTITGQAFHNAHPFPVHRKEGSYQESCIPFWMNHQSFSWKMNAKPWFFLYWKGYLTMNMLRRKGILTSCLQYPDSGIQGLVHLKGYSFPALFRL